MCFHVRPEIALECESLAAEWAVVGLVARVKEEMVLQVCLFAEAAVTHLALVRPRAVVDVHVTLQIAGRRKGLGT